ncbi:MAG: hypothetical protein IJ301_04765 [Clostridia bacterium]|nr:hypothetical protein [Clostridia bacterium]
MVKVVDRTLREKDHQAVLSYDFGDKIPCFVIRDASHTFYGIFAKAVRVVVGRYYKIEPELQLIKSDDSDLWVMTVDKYADYRQLVKSSGNILRWADDRSLGFRDNVLVKYVDNERRLIELGHWAVATYRIKDELNYQRWMSSIVEKYEAQGYKVYDIIHDDVARLYIENFDYKNNTNKKKILAKTAVIEDLKYTSSIEDVQIQDDGGMPVVEYHALRRANNTVSGTAYVETKDGVLNADFNGEVSKQREEICER